jgi:hypothetical protein
MHLVSTWRGRGALTAILALAMLGMGMILASAPTTEAQSAGTAIKQITLSGSEEVPSVTVNGTGSFSGNLTDGNLEFDLSAVAPEITQAHIHLGAKGANGPVVAFLFGPVDPGVGAIHPTGNIKVANLVGPLAGNWKGFTDAMAKGELYVNVHTKANPAGAVRGQIPATPAPRPPATGDTIAPASDNQLMQALGVAIVAGSLVTLTYAVSRRRV